MEEVGFVGILFIRYMQLDQVLITALIEKLRPDTHIFYMAKGEITITLQGIAILYGLIIDGLLMIGYCCQYLRVLRKVTRSNSPQF